MERYLDKALELRVLLQEPGLLLLQGEDVLCRLLENGCLRAGGTSQGPRLLASPESPPPAHLLLQEVLLALAHLAELLSICVGDEGLEGLEARVDALHAPPLVAVGNLPPNPPFLVPLSLRGQWNVGQAMGEQWWALAGRPRSPAPGGPLSSSPEGPSVTGKLPLQNIPALSDAYTPQQTRWLME